MKKIILILGMVTSLIAWSQCFSQSAEGAITYEVKINLHRRLPPGREEMKKMMPEFRTSRELLVFNAAESLYKPIIEDDADEMDNDGPRIQIAKPYFEFYLNSENNELITRREFMGKTYLINTVMEISPWKFSSETRIIQGYDCKQAYYTSDDGKQTITAWYTDKLRSFLGPQNYNTLPGAVLALDINNEEQVYIATKIEMHELKKNELKIPKGGQEITQQEYQKIVDERMQQMGGHGMMIRN